MQNSYQIVYLCTYILYLSTIQEIPENGADVTHLSVLHGPVVFAGSDLFCMRNWWSNVAKHNWEASWTTRTKIGEEHIASMLLYTETVFFDKFRAFRMKVRSDQVRINLCPTYTDSS